MDKIFIEVAVALISGLVGAVWKYWWPYIQALFDGESRRQAAQLNGAWEAHEVFADSDKSTFLLELACTGSYVRGRHYCQTGFDKGKDFEIDGRYKDQILTFTWAPKGRIGLESGTVAARLSKDGELVGHGLYVEPDDGKIHTSKFTATKNRTA